MDELGIWTLQPDGTAEAVKAVSGLDLENRLEETLVQRPDMLEPGIQLVGRQTPTEGGPSDLLGVDKHGRLVVFELKRGRLTREAVTQCIDYASALDAMDPEAEMAGHIAEQSGKHGIAEIGDFKEWYEDHFEDNALENLLPPRLVLVGLGVDARAERMVRFLQTSGIDISVLTFYGFEHGGETLLARQVEVERDLAPTPRRHLLSPAELEERAQRLIEEMGLTTLFNAICETLRHELEIVREQPASQGRTFYVIRRNGRFCSVLVGYPATSEGVVISLPQKSHPHGTALENLKRRIDLQDWPHGGFAVGVDSEEHWEQQRNTVVEYLKDAEAAWRNPSGSATDVP